jgi:hypothetical protein
VKTTALRTTAPAGAILMSDAASVLWIGQTILRKSRTGNRFGAFSRIGVMFGAPFRVAVVSSIPVRTLQGVAAALQRDGGPRPVATGTGVLSIASNSSLVHRADSTASATVITRNGSAGSGASATNREQPRQRTPGPRGEPPTTSPARAAEQCGQRVTEQGCRRAARHEVTVTLAPARVVHGGGGLAPAWSRPRLRSW